MTPNRACTIPIAVRIVADVPPGDYIVKYDMVVEGVTWLAFHGSECPRRSLRITAQVRDDALRV
jgi:hypothetical protein